MGFSVHLDPTADHYGSAEQLFGNFRSSLSQDVSAPVIGATKWCIFRAPTPSNQPLSREYVIDVVRERAKRMRIDFGRNKDEGAIEARVDFLQSSTIIRSSSMRHSATYPPCLNIATRRRPSPGSIALAR
ncbi:hypothetical protein FRC14_005996 [Serendipita sp. 396]|nr:hypothetical protein FRC14_005996 [Serendipita sp. 396]KAG8861104.1 hypothetical protein FRB91_009904 [Serendipita sp. 411]